VTEVRTESIKDGPPRLVALMTIGGPPDPLAFKAVRSRVREP
jgi:hypothetical protein